MDGCSQMVFCTHLSDTADRERGREREGRKERRRDGEQEREKEKQKEVFIDCKVRTLLPGTDLRCLNLALPVLHHLSLCACAFPV